MMSLFRVVLPAGLLGLAGCVSTHTTADETAETGAAAPVSPPPPATAPPPATPTEQPSLAPAAPPRHSPPAVSSPPDPGPGGVQGVSIRFGGAPADYADVEPGVLIGAVAPGSSADLAGIRTGDRLTKWNGKPISDVEGWMPFLAAAKPGDVVEVTYLRDGREAVTKVTLQAKP